ncbi:hypothetical protein ACXR2T_02320 [Leucobacter sp. HY1910]
MSRETTKGAPTAPNQLILRGDLWFRVRSLPAICTDLLLAALVVVGFVYAGPARLSFTVFAFTVGVWLGYRFHRKRGRGVAAQRVLSTTVPLAITVFFWMMMRTTEIPYAALMFLPAAGLGAGLAMAVERWVGPKRYALARAWEGIDRVIGARPGASVATPALSRGQISFKIAALTARISKREVRAFLRQFIAQFPRVSRSDILGRRVVMTVGVIAFAIGMLAFLTGIVEIASEGAEDAAAQLLGMSAVLLLFMFAGAVFIWFLVRTRTRVPYGEDYLRLSRFAADNGFGFDPGPCVLNDGAIETNIMQTVHAVEAAPRLRTSNLEHRQGVALARTTHFSGKCVIELSTELPHVMLFSQDHLTPSFAAFTAPAANQRLSLEGDFDDHFALFCPRGYERDALYLFTPDIMARLIDGARSFDIELVGNLLILRSRRDLVTVDPAVWAELATALTALTDKLAQWERWRDERLLLQRTVQPFAEGVIAGSSGARVAIQGRRLRRGIGPGTWFAMGFVSLYLTLTALANLI